MPVYPKTTGRTRVKKCTIAIGGTVSTEVNLEGATEGIAIELPAAFTGIALTFQAARAAGGTYQGVYDDAGAALSITVAAGRIVAITGAKLDALRGISFLKLVSGGAEAAERTIYLLLKG